ncbi:MAG: hypothetical protein LC687_00095 [Actinobacteria bacterium]|nr:hypothetical protein [Actinomycetota bacterium]
MSKSTFVHNETLMTCPACDQPIGARFVFEIDTNHEAPIKEKTVQMTGNMTGMAVVHDCIPKVTRGQGVVIDQIHTTEPSRRGLL